MSDFFLPISLSAPCDNATVAAFQQVMIKAQQALPWLPNLSQESSSLFYGDATKPYFPRLNRSPSGLDSDQQSQWLMIYDATTNLCNAAIQGEMQTAQAEGARLAADTAFWNTVSRVVTDVATLGVNELWGGFWEAIDACKQSRDITTLALQTAGDVLSALGADADPQDLANQDDIQNQLSALIGKILDAISPLGPDVRAQAGLGVAPLVVAGIAAAVVVTATTAVWAVAHELSGVQEQANAHAQAVLDHQTAYDEAQAAAGNITQDELMRRRANTAKQAKDIADAQGAGAVGSGMMKAGLGVALAVGAVAVAIFFLKKKGASASPAPSTNPRRRR